MSESAVESHSQRIEEMNERQLELQSEIADIHSQHQRDKQQNRSEQEILK